MSRIQLKARGDIEHGTRRASSCGGCSSHAKKKRKSPDWHMVREHGRGGKTPDPRQLSMFAAPREPSSAALLVDQRIPPTRWDLRTFPGSVCPPEQGYPTLFEPRSWHPYRGGWGEHPPYRGYGCQRKRGGCRG